MRKVLCLLLATSALLAGCLGKTPKSHFYSLTPLAPESAKEEGGAPRDFSVGIAPVVLPDYLARPQMVIRRGDRLELAEFHRWGGSLEEDFSRVLAENLSTLLASARVTTYPWAGNFFPNYRLAVDLVRFDGNPEEGVSLVCHWSVADNRTRDVLAVKKVVILQPVSGEGFAALAKAHSLALEELARQIAVALTAI